MSDYLVIYKEENIKNEIEVDNYYVLGYIRHTNYNIKTDYVFCIEQQKQ